MAREQITSMTEMKKATKGVTKHIREQRAPCAKTEMIHNLL